MSVKNIPYRARAEVIFWNIVIDGMSKLRTYRQEVNAPSLTLRKRSLNPPKFNIELTEINHKPQASKRDWKAFFVPVAIGSATGFSIGILVGFLQTLI